VITKERDDVASVLAQGRLQQARSALITLLSLAVIVGAFAYAGALDYRRYTDAFPTLLKLASDALPPDFRRWHEWRKPLFETLAMSVAGTVLGVLAALPLGALAARNVVSSPWIGGPARLLLNVARSIPELIWGVLFVAAVGFGPLPGVLALAAHSAGMVGKFFAETIEHAAPAPGDALRSHGVSGLGVLRFSIFPQILPRLVDISVYRWEHNVRAATTVGMVGAGGLGLEIITAFNLFEYGEASALLLVLLALVTVISLLGGIIRGRFLGTKF
jgi:phosphonate transport system permease protein